LIDLAALQMVLMALTGWLDHHERQILAYLIQENRILRQQRGGRRLRLRDDERRCLAVHAYRVGTKAQRALPPSVQAWQLSAWFESSPAKEPTLPHIETPSAVGCEPPIEPAI